MTPFGNWLTGSMPETALALRIWPILPVATDYYSETGELSTATRA